MDRDELRHDGPVVLLFALFCSRPRNLVVPTIGDHVSTFEIHVTSVRRMCHPDAPTGADSVQDVTTEEIAIPMGDGTSMPAYVAGPASAPPTGSVIVVGDIHGARTPFYEQ